jgi:hypothetical protein
LNAYAGCVLGRLGVVIKTKAFEKTCYWTVELLHCTSKSDVSTNS